MADPYLLDDGITLKNKLGVTDPVELAHREDQLSTFRQAILDSSGPAFPPFDFGRLSYIHHFLFQDVYEWAGDTRECNISKAVHDEPDSPHIPFIDRHLIPRRAAEIFSRLADEDYFMGLPGDAFAVATANFFVELNNLHPFREGNGRTQRAFLRQLALNAGYDLAFDVVTKERMVAVSVAGITGDRDPAIRMFREILDPRRVAALRKALNFLKQSQSVSWNDIYISTTVAGQLYQGVLVGQAGDDFMMRVSSDPDDWIAIGDVEDLPPGTSSSDPLDFQAKKF